MKQQQIILIVATAAILVVGMLFLNLDKFINKASLTDEAVSWGAPFPHEITFFYGDRVIQQDGVYRDVGAKFGKSVSFQLNKDTWWIHSEGLESEDGFRSARDYTFTMLCADGKDMSVKSRPGYWACFVMSHDSSVPVDVYVDGYEVLTDISAGGNNIPLIYGFLINKDTGQVYDKISAVDAIEGW